MITEKIDNYSEYINKLVHKYASTEVKLSFSYNKLTIYLSNDFLKLYNKLKEEKVSFYSYTPKQLRNKHIIAKGLPELPVQEIIEDLKVHGVNCENAVIFKKKATEKHTYNNPVCKLTFDRDMDMKIIIWNIDTVCYVKVKWERYKNSRLVTQCRNFQMFGHGTNYCHNDSRCVKCDHYHLTKDCTKSADTPPKCVNCKEPHLANHSKCSKYLKHVERVQKRKSANQTHNKIGNYNSGKASKF